MNAQGNGHGLREMGRRPVMPKGNDDEPMHHKHHGAGQQPGQATGGAKNGRFRNGWRGKGSKIVWHVPRP